MAREDIETFILENDIAVDAAFVPFSQSRNKGEKTPSLNWIVTLKINGRPILMTDYMAGCGHCPAYNGKVPPRYPNSEKMWRRDAVAWECENGKRADHDGFTGGFRAWRGGPMTTTKEQPLKPDPRDVLYSLAMDSDVLDYGTFEDWAGDFGYDADSRSAEAIYRACLEIALKLRNSLGEARLAALKTACEGY